MYLILIKPDSKFLNWLLKVKKTFLKDLYYKVILKYFNLLLVWTNKYIIPNLNTLVILNF